MDITSDSGRLSIILSISTILCFSLLSSSTRSLINGSCKVLFNLMAKFSHYINNTEEEETSKLTCIAKVKKKTPGSDLGKPLLG